MRHPISDMHVAVLGSVTTIWLAGLLAVQPLAGQDHRDWSHDLATYEVNVRQYTEAGTFEAFATHLDRLQELGVGILWFMPIHPIGRVERLGSLGSYYSVRDYLDVNPEFGSLEDFRSLVQGIHDRGMYVIMDWVANHTAWDNVLTTEHPEWYVTNASGNFIAPPGTNWSDVIELDYSEQGLRDYMIEAMKFWALDVGVDGFRCDAVSFVPTSFWSQAIDELKAAKPGLLMLAEGDGRLWHDVGFDMTYGWGLYGFGGGVLKRIADGVDNASNFSVYTADEAVTYPREAYRMYFTSNHDENSWYGTTRELFGNAAEVFAVLTATFNGLPLIYSGQEAGLDRRLLFFDKDSIVWGDHPNAELYSALLRLKKQNRALWNGESGAPLRRILNSNNSDVFSFVREKDGDVVLVVANLSNQQQSVTLSGSRTPGEYLDAFTGSTVVLEAGAAVTLPPWGYEVYHAGTPGTSVEDLPDVADVTLSGPFPNPVRDYATVSYTLPEGSDVRLSVLDLLGREVKVVRAGYRSPGTHRATIAASGLPAGLYVLQLAGGRAQAKKFVVVR